MHLCVDVTVSGSKKEKKKRDDGWREKPNERGKNVAQENEVDIEQKR